MLTYAMVSGSFARLIFLVRSQTQNRSLPPLTLISKLHLEQHITDEASLTKLGAIQSDSTQKPCPCLRPSAEAQKYSSTKWQVHGSCCNCSSCGGPLAHGHHTRLQLGTEATKNE
ncbi:hypothetical protein VOLCADRAFT_93226 [Volvox carteri f. nagariensis]|uniref:Uncharacterized protein n=1 Tax=Volvox carteri f. nagariensis TaxID=3068 RepID=D8U1M0_VOLCA|nr:uncharacterized protein VOLCADRAFT_93226 [Volvox carteri f. nagariensis]EFJ46436.1 hypothetical protein VOLCADRAFT_93226 [Volvox carteri f. nagariensis]|eukprot:XP_002952589.1 hypothetical protein VOLCADRAFT_93226 [Volvox carteri f. nagariensis]